MPKLSFFSFFDNVALQACLTTELLSQWVVPQDVGLLRILGTESSFVESHLTSNVLEIRYNRPLTHTQKKSCLDNLKCRERGYQKS